MMGIITRGAALLLLAAAVAAAPRDEASALRDHPSAYLAMHAADPVAWQLWGPEVLARARREGKLVLVSSGYFACHWCHVMQRESFRSPRIAGFLNRHFIAVKVDRELLPALDAQLIRFIAHTGGRAGWPLNVFLTPEGHPLVGVTYLPASELLGVLERLQERWRSDPQGLRRVAEAGSRELAGDPQPAPALTPAAITAHHEALVRAALASADHLAGGFGYESKFPASPQLLALLAAQRRDPDPELGAFLRVTLDQMARRGLRDPLGGGFFRYTVDPDWATPHFEKMLYDNAQLAEVYRQGAEVLGEPAYREVARETLDFLAAEMAHPSGGFLGSLSAVDGAGTEGGYYLWSDEALRAALDPETLRVATLAWGLDGPTLEGGRLPVAALGPQAVAERIGLSGERVREILSGARERLLQGRVGRGLPRDGKLVAAWNGLALEALARAVGPGGPSPHRAAGARLRDLIATRLWSGRTLARALVDGRAVGEAALEDYAQVAAGLLAWAEVGGDREALTLAARLAREAWGRFRGAAGWRLDQTALFPLGAEDVVVPDGPTPSPSAVLLRVSLRLGELGADADLARRAREVLALDYPVLAESPLVHATHITVLAERR